MIRVNDLRKTYDRRSKRASHALRGVSFDLPETGFVCIVGPSGCGKTSLLNAIGGLDTFDSGSVSTESLDALRCGNRATEAERNRSFGYIFQNYYLLDEYSAAYNVYLGLHSLALSHEEKLGRVREALRAVDMERFARRAVGKLSGGQQQRVAIARALARRPRVIFADEPTGNLDEANTRNICTLLRQISRHSLVVMVTHEERIARFFADRIITIEDGVLTSDTTDWVRGDLADETPTLYTSEYAETVAETDGVTLRLLREEGAAPLELTVVAEKNRIVIKLDDRRTLSVGASDDAPALVEGERPALRLEQLEQDAVEFDWHAPSPQGRAGSGLKLPTLMREARRLLGFKGLRQLGSWLFLVLLTVMTLVTVGDYLMVASIEPEDFITTDSHILELNFERGEWLGAETLTLDDLIYAYTHHLDASGLDFEFLPNVSLPVTYSVNTFTQMASESENLGGFSYLPLDALDESTLILGRAPENASEIAVDRWVLEKMMERDGIIQSGITDVGYFLGRTLDYLRKDFSPEIVGITDCGEPAVFFDRAALVSIGVAGTEAIRLSDLRKLAPGVYDDLEIAADECVVITNNAGVGYTSRIGGVFTAGGRTHLTIASVIEQEGTFASIVVADDTLDEILRRMLNSKFYLYCEDKQAMKDYIAAGLPADIEGNLVVSVVDKHDDAWASYRAATELRADERSIVTLAVILLSLVMLYLLQRSKVHGRIGMIAVYRLLGIPMRKLAAIFALEALLFSLVSALPAAVITCAVVAVMEALPSLETPLLLPWHAAAAVYGCILVFHVAASLLPLVRLGRLPPAHLARESDL